MTEGGRECRQEAKESRLRLSKASSTKRTSLPPAAAAAAADFSTCCHPSAGYGCVVLVPSEMDKEFRGAAMMDFPLDLSCSQHPSLRLPLSTKRCPHVLLLLLLLVWLVMPVYILAAEAVRKSNKGDTHVSVAVLPSSRREWGERHSRRRWHTWLCPLYLIPKSHFTYTYETQRSATHNINGLFSLCSAAA